MNGKANVDRQRGISLLEALITIIVLAFGILGLAGLQAKMQSAEVESYARSQALLLLDDMAARLNANHINAAAYVTATPAGTGDTQPTDCSLTALGVDRDLCEWSNALKGNSEVAAGSGVGAMIGGRGCVEQLVGANPPSYRIAVAWQGLTATVIPRIDCAQNLYGGNDAFRRVVAKVVTIGNGGP
ncbi:MAG TPA: prepilin-type N-terminal cleavage/methylation domain-containing protein [Jatrophihabitantaceae bacterium]|nr:prepilin-type N-terminal cleavage/methylation domain-containing protein [Jatrophihabitantaceae bacterium]